jgi:glutamate-1-semialdehyde 2,1-aminomutase
MRRPLTEDQLYPLIVEQVEIFKTNTVRSSQLAELAVQTMPLAVPNSIYALNPYPVIIEQGDRQFITDIDNNVYCDYGAGYGATIVGHNNAFITDALTERVKNGVHFGANSSEAVQWSQLMCSRFNLDWVRFSASGTEATMDALRMARALTGRCKIIKIEGAYHGSHPWAMISTQPDLELAGDPRRPDAVPFGEGLKPDITETIIPIPFNDLDAAEQALSNNDVAALIIEPILFNVGAIFPEDDYLLELQKLCQQHHSLLIFDEVKTGAAISYGGAEETFQVTPDLKTFGKVIGGGLSCGAIGGATDLGFKAIESWQVPHLGTYSGNPLTATAGVAALRDVLTPASYQQLQTHTQQLLDLINPIIEEFDLPAYVVGLGAKFCIVWSDPDLGHLSNYREYDQQFNAYLGYLHWAFMFNNGFWLTPGRDEQITHSVAHTPDDATRFADLFKEFAVLLTNNLK